MYNEVFSSWLIELDKTVGKKKLKILLFVDNCTAHIPIHPLKWVSIKFSAVNTTYKLQSLDVGIIKNSKVLTELKWLENIFLTLKTERCS